jgi:beta-glucosidase
MKASYWSNRKSEGEPLITQQISAPLALTAAGQHAFATGVPLQGFSAKYESVYKASTSGQLVFRIEATGSVELKVNGVSLKKFGIWRPTPARIPLTVEAGKEYHIEVHYIQLQNWTASLKINFGWEIPVSFDALIDKLKGVDLVIFAGGISARLEGEEMPVDVPGFKGGDRTDIELPAVQRNCIKTLKQAGKKIVFINCSGSAIGLVPETQNCEAILQAWYAGEDGGQAIADVLFGDFNPSGKLPVTFYRNKDQLPGFPDYSMKGRTYRFMSDPLFPFGFGLSYTTFSIGEGRLSKAGMDASGKVDLTIPVANTGSRQGTEIVQVYIRRIGDPDGPLRTLRSFQRVTLPPGRQEEIKIPLDADSFEFFDRTSGSMKTASGEYEILYGNSSADKDLKRLKLSIL